MVMAAIAAALVLGAPGPDALLVLAAWYAPGVAAVGLCAWVATGVIRRRAADSPAEELALLAVAADLRSGVTLRAALAGADRLPREVLRMARAGRPMSDLADALGQSQDRAHRLLAPSLRIMGETGGSAAPVFEAVAGMLIDDGAVRREIRMATLGPVTQAVIIGGLPLGSLGWTVASGSFAAAIDRGGVEATLVTLGAGLTALGMLIVSVAVRKVARWR